MRSWTRFENHYLPSTTTGNAPLLNVCKRVARHNTSRVAVGRGATNNRWRCNDPFPGHRENANANCRPLFLVEFPRMAWLWFWCVWHANFGCLLDDNENFWCCANEGESHQRRWTWENVAVLGGKLNVTIGMTILKRGLLQNEFRGNWNWNLWLMFGLVLNLEIDSSPMCCFHLRKLTQRVLNVFKVKIWLFMIVNTVAQSTN